MALWFEIYPETNPGFMGQSNNKNFPVSSYFLSKVTICMCKNAVAHQTDPQNRRSITDQG